MARLSAIDRFRAKAWLALVRREDVLALSPRGFKLLAGVTWSVVNPLNNGEFTLGPRTLAGLGFNGSSGRDALADLVAARLLTPMTDAHKGSARHYALATLPLTLGSKPLSRRPARSTKPMRPQSIETGKFAGLDSPCLSVESLAPTKANISDLAQRIRQRWNVNPDGTLRFKGVA